MTEKRANSSVSEYIIQLIKNEKPETVSQLIALVRQKYPLTEQDILEALTKLESEGKIHFGEKERPISPTQTGYVFSSDASWFWAVILLSTVTTIAAFVIPQDAYPIVAVRWVLGVVFVLFLPGYSLVKAVFPSRKELDVVELVAFSLGLSLALVPVAALLLNYTPWGIGFTPIILSLLVLTVAFATVAVMRDYQAKKRETQSVSAIAK